MKVLLIREVQGLGIPGDVVDVRDGFARNYLLPRKLAVPPSPHELQKFQTLREQYALELADRHTRAQALAEKLNGAEIPFSRRVHDQDRLYAAVRPQDVARAVSERFGEKIEASRIKMDPIDKLGEHEIEISIYEGISAKLKVVVTPAA